MKNKTVFKRVIAVIGRSKLLLFLSLILSVASVILSLYIPVLAGRAIDGIKLHGNVDFEVIKKCLFGILICAIVGGVLQWVMNIINNRIAYNTVRDIRSKAFSHMQTLPVAFADSHPYGDIVSRITADAEQFADGLILGFSQLFTGVVTIAVTLVFMLTISPLITLAVVVLTPISLFTARFIARRTYSMFKKQSETRGEQTALINEMIQNQKTVQAFSYEDRAVERFDESNEKLRKYSLKSIFFSSLTNPTTRFINNLIYAVVGLMGGIFAIGGMVTVGGFVSFLAYSNQYTKPFNEISGVVTELQNALACAARIFELIDEKPEESDENCSTLDDPEGSVEFDNVRFSYDKSKKLIDGFDFFAPSGKTIAVVGPTGCGKTTLINLLLRFYDVDGGSIKVDGENINDITRHSLRHHFGMVLQDTWIKNGTVRENIAFGKPDATDEEIIAAAKAARAHSFIKRLKNGYDTVIGDDDGLSEGERQLLCIARVMLMKPPMLILDEATSSIDTRTELKVQDAFNTLMQGRTSFVVAHRLSTIRHADCILVMKDGKVAEQGTHEELLAKNGFYTRLYNSQFAQ
ncbi:MAG TPA: sugar ABC transporter ATP-binding protein [Ruminococcaceae bacterium]|nr:sugar ABC transporter ATP-binding protein [Oscillospiraceae bacterium]